MIYEIAVGAFIALALYDFVEYLSIEVARRVNIKRTQNYIKEMLDLYDDQDEYVFESAKPRKKAAVKKKPAAKRK